MTARSLSKEKLACFVEDCINPQSSKGYCRMHYQRFKRHGDATFTLKKGRKTSGDQIVPIQDLCCLMDIFPFLQDEEYMSQFKID